MSECTAALDAQPTFFKALLRRAKAYEQLGNYKQALSDLQRANKLDAANGEGRVRAWRDGAGVDVRVCVHVRVWMGRACVWGGGGGGGGPGWRQWRACGQASRGAQRLAPPPCPAVTDAALEHPPPSPPPRSRHARQRAARA